MNENQKVLKLLQTYEHAQGQQINKSKTFTSFSENVTQSAKRQIRNFWGNTGGLENANYLDLSQMIGTTKTMASLEIKQRVWMKLQSWKEKFLSQGEKEVLIKAVTIAISTYIMSCFKLPRALYDELGKQMAHFLQEQQDEQTKIYWVSWKNMYKPKKEGGMDFKDLHAFNMVLLAK